jgi:TPR repeat protein
VNDVLEHRDPVQEDAGQLPFRFSTVGCAMYEIGDGVPQDDKTALKWYTLAAEQGNALAQNNLGLMYYNGQGVLQDYVYAHMWWTIAAASGHKDASENRDIVAKEMTSTEIAKAEKLASECVAKKYKGC